jgi:protein-S-isoprenylcysteine O-methyltransferase Ste14
MIWLVLAFGLWAFLHSWLASFTVKKWLEKRLGAGFFQRFYRLAYNLFAVVSFLPILVLLGTLPDRSLYRLPAPWSVLAMLVQVLGAAFLVWGLLVTDVWDFIGLRQALGQTNREEKLVLTGPYRLVRHPLYTGGLLVIWFAPLMTWNGLVFNLLVTLYLYIGARFEERKLRRIFGEAYAAYQQQVPMLLPRIKV